MSFLCVTFEPSPALTVGVDRELTSGPQRAPRLGLLDGFDSEVVDEHPETITRHDIAYGACFDQRKLGRGRSDHPGRVFRRVRGVERVSGRGNGRVSDDGLVVRKCSDHRCRGRHSGSLLRRLGAALRQVTFDQGEYEAIIAAFVETGEKEWLQADVTIDGVEYQQVGMRLKGNSSLGGLGGAGMGGPRRDRQARRQTPP